MLRRDRQLPVYLDRSLTHHAKSESVVFPRGPYRVTLATNYGDTADVIIEAADAVDATTTAGNALRAGELRTTTGDVAHGAIVHLDVCPERGRRRRDVEQFGSSPGS